MSNLAALNDLRRTAKALGMTGYGRMKFADLEVAVDVFRSAQNEQTIADLRAEHVTATPDRQEQIIAELARMGAVLYPQGTKEHEAYAANLRAALADPNAFAFLGDPFAGDMVPEPGDVEYPAATSDVEQEFAAAVDADDHEAMSAILEEAAPTVLVPIAALRDPNATRYEDLALWTDERLDTKETELAARLTRRTLLGGDRKLTENRLARVKAEIESRSI